MPAVSDWSSLTTGMPELVVVWVMVGYLREDGMDWLRRAGRRRGAGGCILDTGPSR